MPVEAPIGIDAWRVWQVELEGWHFVIVRFIIVVLSLWQHTKRRSDG